MNITKSKLKSVTYSIALAATTLTPAFTNAGTLYVYEQSNQQLGTIDPSTGAVTIIGDLIPPVGSVNDLEFVGNRLFAIEIDYPNTGWLIEINPETAEIINRSPLLRDGVPLTNAIEGLACDGQGGLVISYWQNAAIIQFSNLISPVAFDGTVAASPVHSPWVDMDSLTRNLDGGYWLSDREPNTQTVEIRKFDTLASASTQVNQWFFDTTVNGLQELADNGEHLIATDRITNNLHIIDRTTGLILNSVPTAPEFTLTSIAYLEDCLADLTNDGSLNFFDVSAFLTAFNTNDPAADFTGDGNYNFFDVSAFLAAFAAGCP